MTTSSPRKLRILMLHGYTQSGPLFHAKTRALEKNLQKAFPVAARGVRVPVISSVSHGGQHGPPRQQRQNPPFPDGVELVYPTAPIRLSPAQIPGFTRDGHDADEGRRREEEEEEETEAYGWWVRADEPSSSRMIDSANPQRPPTTTTRTHSSIPNYEYKGLETECLPFLAGLLSKAARDGEPFTGVIGFSQGAALAAMLASLLEPGRRAVFERRADERRAAGYANCMSFPSTFVDDDPRRSDDGSTTDGPTDGRRTGDEPTYDSGTKNPDGIIHPPLRFAVSYSGFAPDDTHDPHAPYAAFYAPTIRTPVLHFLGSLDTVVDEARSLRLVDACRRVDLNDENTTTRTVESRSGKSSTSTTNTTPRDDDDEARRQSRVIYHPGGHFLPSSQKQYVAALVAFIRAMTARHGGGRARDARGDDSGNDNDSDDRDNDKHNETGDGRRNPSSSKSSGSGTKVGNKTRLHDARREERVEDMDMPF